MTPRKNYMSMYLKCPTLIQKQVSKNILFFAVGVTFFTANVSDFTRNLLVKIKNFLIKNLFPYKKKKIKNFELSYLHKRLSYTNTFK
jgi:hypothetical protein